MTIDNSAITPSGNDVESFGDEDYAQFVQEVEKKANIKLDYYREAQMRRRIQAHAIELRFTSYNNYVAAWENEPALVADFRSYITIHVSELLRNPQRYDELAKIILPNIIAQRGERGLTAWSAGCSFGAEAYSLAMLLDEVAPQRQHKILGTDIDLESLTKAKLARFSESDMANVSETRRKAYFHAIADGMFTPNQKLIDQVSFDRHDLLSDPIPENHYDLIACRNVLIYFTPDTQKALYRQFFQALKPGGILFLGSHERMTSAAEIGFSQLLPFFYCKP